MSRYDPKQQYKRTIAGLGITELIIGILMVIFGIFTVAAHDAAVAHYVKETVRSKNIERVLLNPDAPPFDPATIILDDKFTYISQGIWCGAAMIATGILGLVVKSMPTKTVYTANMIMAVATVHMGIVSIVLSVFAVNRGFFNVALIVAHSFIGLLSAVVVAVSITHAVYCISGTCSSETSTATYNSQTETTSFKTGITV